MSTRISLADILTTSSSVANYLAEANVTPEHLDRAVALLLGEISLEDIAPPRSPLIPRPPPGPATPPVREFAQRWLQRLGNDMARELPPVELLAMRAEIAALIARQPR